MLAVVGCGNINKTDDGVGSVVAAKLYSRLQSCSKQNGKQIKVFDAATSGMDVMFQAKGCQRLVIVDACKSGSKPGTIFVVPGHSLENVKPVSFNLHDFRWDQAIYAGKQMFKDEFPSEITVYLIEAESTEFGFQLTEHVQQAAESVVDKILSTL